MSWEDPKIDCHMRKGEKDDQEVVREMKYKM